MCPASQDFENNLHRREQFPAKRPEFVDLSLGSTGSDKSQSSSDSFTTNQSAMISSSDETNNNPDDEKHKKKNDDRLNQFG